MANCFAGAGPENFLRADSWCALSIGVGEGGSKPGGGKELMEDAESSCGTLVIVTSMAIYFLELEVEEVCVGPARLMPTSAGRKEGKSARMLVGSKWTSFLVWICGQNGARLSKTTWRQSLIVLWKRVFDMSLAHWKK